MNETGQGKNEVVREKGRGHLLVCATLPITQGRAAGWERLKTRETGRETGREIGEQTGWKTRLQWT